MFHIFHLRYEDNLGAHGWCSTLTFLLICLWFGGGNNQCMFAHDGTRGTLNVHVAYLTLIDPEPLTLKKDTAGTQSDGDLVQMIFLFNWVIFRFQPFIFRGVLNWNLPHSRCTETTLSNSQASHLVRLFDPHLTCVERRDAKNQAQTGNIDLPRWYLEDAYQNLYLLQ